MVRWSYAFIDRPAAGFDAALTFWSAVTRTRISPRRGARKEFATLVPEGTDASVKVQAVGDDDGGGGAHIDLSFVDAAEARRASVELGATVVSDHGTWAVMRSPSGVLYCLGPWHGEVTRPAVVEGPGGLSRVDQVCLDIAPDAYPAEVAFWRAVTGWEFRPGSRPEFSVLKPPPGLPVRLLLQRLDAARPASAHIDLACSDVDAVRAWHEEYGATVVDRRPGWTVMRDPAGGVYCLTARDPHTGTVRRPA